MSLNYHFSEKILKIIKNYNQELANNQKAGLWIH